MIPVSGDRAPKVTAAGWLPLTAEALSLTPSSLALRPWAMKTRATFLLRNRESGTARYAVNHTFVSRTDSGGTIFAISSFAGIYGAAFSTNASYPGRQADAAHALERGTTAMGARDGGNLFREFGPDILKRLRHR